MNIREIRLSVGMTQKEFAEYFHLSKRTLEKWEQGVSKCPSYLIELIIYKLEKENKI